MFVYRHVNACKDMFVYILHTFDESCVDKIDERNRFPYEICVSHYRGHPIPRVSQLPNIYTMVFSVT